MNFYLKRTLVICFVVYTVWCHCRLDLSLEYLELNNMTKSSSSKFETMFNQINNKNKEKFTDDEINFMNSVAQPITYNNFQNGITLKSNIVKNNIKRIINTFCKKINYKVTHSAPFSSGHFGDAAFTRGKMSNSKLVYDQSGNIELVVKIMKKKGALSNINEFFTYLGDVAKEVRSGQCLYDIFNYDIDSEKFNDIKDKTLQRDNIMGEFLVNEGRPVGHLDAVGAIDCQFYTPEMPSNLELPINERIWGVNENTLFYLGMPKMDGDLEHFFFDSFEKNYLNLNNLLDINTIEFRLWTCQELLQSIVNVHNLGFINKDIKPENYLFKYAKRYDSKFNFVFSMADFGLSGIDDYNTFQYSDVNYRPEDSLTFLNKTIDVYQMGISIFQLLFNLPKARTNNSLSLSSITKIANSAPMLFSYVNNNAKFQSSISSFIPSNKFLCFQEIFRNIAKDLYDFGNENYFGLYHKTAFVNPELVQTLFRNNSFLELAENVDFRTLIRTYIILYYIKSDICHSFDSLKIFSFSLFYALHPNSKLRDSSKAFLRKFNGDIAIFNKNDSNIPNMNYVYEVYRNNQFLL